MNLISTSDKIAVFGSNGMAGGAICRALKKNGYLNLLTPKRGELDLSNFNKVENWFNLAKPDVVIIAAAKVGGIYANNNYPADFILENLKIQNNIIEIAWKGNVKKLLFLGSSCIYPKFSKQPISEEALLSGDLEPTNQWYAIAKISGIKLCEALKKQYNFNSISLMPTNLYGPGDNYHPKNSHVLPGLIRRFCEAKVKKQRQVVCWGTGSPYREFLHVDDLGQACVFALEKWDLDLENAPKDSSGETLSFLNVGTGSDISIKELANLIAKYVDYDGEIVWDTSKPDGTPKKQLDVRRINSIGWHSKINIEEGLRDTIKIYKEKNFKILTY
tara:strand:+ start:1326 stop:2318 length:993 start_codon:yes stop_codon:yes gene_type:complete